MIEYIKLFWESAPEGEPPVILYEVDTENERLVLRSIDIFAEEFRACAIEKAEFEAIWESQFFA